MAVTNNGPEGPFCSSIPPEGEGSFVGMADDPVASAASNNPYLTTLTSAVQAAGLVDTLNGEGPFTVFAPNNEAFAKIPPEDLDGILANTEWLTSILLYHVVIGESLSAAGAGRPRQRRDRRGRRAHVLGRAGGVAQHQRRCRHADVLGDHDAERDGPRDRHRARSTSPERKPLNRAPTRLIGRRQSSRPKTT